MRKTYLRSLFVVLLAALMLMTSSAYSQDNPVTIKVMGHSVHESAVTGGADLVLASSVIPVPSTKQGSGARDLVSSWLSMSDAIAHERSLDHLNAIDVLITPDIAGFSAQAFDQAEQLIDCGRQAAQQVLPRIRSLLQQEE